MCAIECAKDKNCKVDIYEQNKNIGKKILVSGNGKCNITNSFADVCDYSSQNPEFAKFALKSFPFGEFEKFALDVGIILDTKKDGKTYPLSYEAKSVVTLLQNKALMLGIDIKTSTKITTIKPLFEKYDAVVVATGSQAAPHLGGSNDGYSFASEFGHNIITPYPSLVGLELYHDIHSKMEGVKLNAEVSLFLNNKKTSIYGGDILFTSYGISGLAILDISTEVSQAILEYQKTDISINLMPTYTPQKLLSVLQKVIKNTTNILDAIHAILPIKVAKTLLDTLNIDHNTKWQNPNTKDIKKIINKIQNFKFEVKATHGFRHAEVSGGGIDTTQIDPKTMCSLLQKNLYFCGEVIDIVGRRGGFNFAWAWASGHLAAKDIQRRNILLPYNQK